MLKKLAGDTCDVAETVRDSLIAKEAFRTEERIKVAHVMSEADWMLASFFHYHDEAERGAYSAKDHAKECRRRIRQHLVLLNEACIKALATIRQTS